MVIGMILFVLSAVLTMLCIKIMPRLGILDMPGPRSLHSRPLPRAGGTAIVITFFIGVALYLLIDKDLRFQLGYLTPLLIGALIIALAGFFDDVKNIHRRYKFIAQIIAATILVCSGLLIRSVTLPLLGELRLGIFAIPVTFIWIVGLTNAYNFMDGIDGLSAVQGLLVALFVGAVSFATGLNTMFYISIIIFFSILGFIVFNIPPAKIFMGDVGSTFLGFIFAATAVRGSQKADISIPFIVFVIILFVFVFDTSVTLIRRIYRKEKFLEPHCSHYYQRLVLLGIGQKKVLAIETVLMLLVGLLGLIYALSTGVVQFYILLSCILLLSSMAVIVNILEKQGWWQKG